MSTEKQILRARMRAARDRFMALTAAPAFEAPLCFLDRLSPGLTIASYVPIGSEADPFLLACAASHAGCAIALAHVTTRDQPMRFLAWRIGDDLVPGPFGLLQPHHAAAELDPDIILTPLLAFDSKLDRLGQGAGYYDRAFASFPHALRIGIAWNIQCVDTLPTEPWDIPLDAVVTESGWITAI